MLPIAERHVMKWNGDPYQLDHGGDGRARDDGTFILLPYWMGATGSSWIEPPSWLVNRLGHETAGPGSLDFRRPVPYYWGSLKPAPSARKGPARASTYH